MNTSNLLEAIRVVKENEKTASERYAKAATQISSSMGKKLFKQLSDFEKFHYERITALEKSLEEKGDFIAYGGKEFSLPPVFEIQAAKEPDQKTVMTILTEAIQLEKEAEKAYTDLASQITDQQGHEMFNKLSEEEHLHYRILLDAYWTLNNFGTWKWSRP